jgi:hypothetical protein
LGELILVPTVSKFKVDCVEGETVGNVEVEKRRSRRTEVDLDG